MGLMRAWPAYLSGSAAGVAVGILGAFLMTPHEYTAEAVLQMRQVEHPLPRLPLHNVMARSALANIINTHGLYAEDRKREPLEDIIERMRRNIKVSTNEGQVRLSFRYPEARLSKKVAEDLSLRLIREFGAEMANRNALWTQTWKDEIEVAARAWDEAAQAAAKSPSPRAAYDVELAKQRYALVKAKLAEAQHEAMVLKRGMGPQLEFIDPAAVRTETASPWALPMVGLLIGAIATAFLRGFR